jgi:hypothetical protein
MAEPSGWDLRTTFVTPVTQFALWLAPVLLVTWAGYPGVVCVTPLAWLIALRVGLLVMTKSSSPTVRRRFGEAAVAGGVLGLLLGLLMAVILAGFLLSAVLTLAGAPAGALLSLFTAWLTANRLART